MEIADIIGRRGVLIGDKSREVSRIIKLLCRGDDVIPRAPRNADCYFLRYLTRANPRQRARYKRGEITESFGQAPHALVVIRVEVVKRFRNLILRKGRRGITRL